MSTETHDCRKCAHARSILPGVSVRCADPGIDGTRDERLIPWPAAVHDFCIGFKHRKKEPSR